MRRWRLPGRVRRKRPTPPSTVPAPALKEHSRRLCALWICAAPATSVWRRCTFSMCSPQPPSTSPVSRLGWPAPRSPARASQPSSGSWRSQLEPAKFASSIFFGEGSPAPLPLSHPGERSLWRTLRALLGDLGAGERIDAFVMRVARMAANPMPQHLMARARRVEPPPEILVLDRLVVGGAPAARLPVAHPGRDALPHVLRVGVEIDRAGAGQGFK